MTVPAAVAVALDGALCETRRIWDDWLVATASVLGIEARALPRDRAQAADELDRRGAGNWRTLLARWAEERAPVYVRRDAQASSALRSLAGGGVRIGVFTDAPDELAQVALTHLGLDRRIAALETGTGARERLLALLGDETVVVETREELLSLEPRT